MNYQGKLNAMEKHATAIIDPGATIGKNTKIWHWSHICSGAEIGNDCKIGQNVFIANTVRIGNNVKIQNNVSIYDNIIIEDDVFCGPSMVFTNVYNPRSQINRKAEYRTTLIKRGATLGANSTIICGVIVDSFAFIGAGAVITRDVKSYALMTGVPARQIGWMSSYGNRIELPLRGKGLWKCPNTGETYQLNGETITHKK